MSQLFDKQNGAEGYAKNSSKKHEADRYVVKIRDKFYVSEDTDINDWEEIVAHYKNGEKI